ncbi:MAG: GNAT family N-acetyltransferase [Candidatus Thorarchaeota archaeon]
MSPAIRDLEESDMEQVNAICSTTWGGNDYIPEVLPYWISNQDYIVRGLFDEKTLLSICTLHIVPSTDIGYISGLRTREERRREGYGKVLTEDLVNTAREDGVKHLLYLTINFNEASMGFAKNLGFSLIEQYGSFHLYAPFPSHQTPSPTLIPIKTDPERLDEVLGTSPSLIPNDYIPFDFQFYQKTLNNLRRISERTEYSLVIDTNGQPGGLFYGSPLREDRGERATSYVVYTINRAIFVDMMARIVDEIESMGATRVTFIMGPNATKWVADLGYRNSEMGTWPGDNLGRRLLLYELQL